jgi:arylsulfatase
MALRELIAKHKGKYMAHWDSCAKSGIVGSQRWAWWILNGLPGQRAADTPAWIRFLGREQRYDHMMAVYAAMIEAIDRSGGTLVKGLKQRRVLDNTLILFLRQWRHGEAGPKGRS